MKDLISVVVPVYKVENYLEACLDSILQQTYKNIEILLIDDGSPDKCPDICDEYAKNDSRIYVYHKENGGLSDARNFGIERSNGDFICFIDSDDIIDKNYLKHLLELQKEYNADIVECNYCNFYSDVIDYNNSEVEVRVINNMQAIGELYKVKGCSVLAWNKLYKKNLFDKIRYPKLKVHEDVFTTYKLFFDAKVIVYTSEILYLYRQRFDSISKTFNENRLDVFEAYKEIDLFYRTMGLENYVLLNIQRALNVCLRFYTETDDSVIKKNIKKQYNYFYELYKLYNGPKKLILKIRYCFFDYIPGIDSFFIKIIDWMRKNKKK